MMIKQTHSQKAPHNFIIVGPMRFRLQAIKSYFNLKHTTVVFIDGGSIHLEKLRKISPLLIKNAIYVGDGDSSKKVMTIKKTNENLSDLAFYLQELIKIHKKMEEKSQYIFMGFLGGRHDHQMFNLGEIAKFVKKMGQTTSSRVIMDNKIEFFTAGKHSLLINGIFSVASFEENKIKISGDCLYKTKGWLTLLPFSSRGLSNQGYGKVSLETKTPLAIFYS